MNADVPGAGSGDEQNTDPSAARHNDETTTDRSGTDGPAAGDQTNQEAGDTGDGRADLPEAKGTPSTSMSAGRAAAPPSDRALASTGPGSPGGRRGSAVMVVLALIVGALIGAGVVAATQSNDDAAKTGAGSTSSPAPTASASPSVEPTASPSTTVVIPAICMNLADDAQVIIDLSTQAAEAARDLKAAKLSSIVRELDTAQQLLRKDTAACRAGQSGA